MRSRGGASRGGIPSSGIARWIAALSVVLAGETPGRAATPSPSVEAPFGTLGTLRIEMIARAPGTSDLVPMSEESFASWWGAARCVCGHDAQVGVRLTLLEPRALGAGRIEIWTGTSCLDSSSRTPDCGGAPLGTIEVDALASGPQQITFDAARLIAPPDGQCTSSFETNRIVWVFLDSDGDGRVDASASLGDIAADTEVPPAPKAVALTGAKNRLILSWSFDGIARATDVRQVQALCTAAADPPSSEQKLPKKFDLTASFVRGEDVCGVTSTSTAGGSPIDRVDPSPDYLCGEGDPGDGQLTIDLAGLDPSTVTRVRLVAIDPAGNYTIAKPDPEEAIPVSSDDFWQIYKQAGGQGVGCRAAAPLSRSHPASLIVLVPVVLALLRRRRSLLGAVVLAATSATIAPRVSYAQTSTAAIDRIHYDEDEARDPDRAPADPSRVDRIHYDSDAEELYETPPPANPEPPPERRPPVTLGDGSRPFDRRAAEAPNDPHPAKWAISVSLGPYKPEVDGGLNGGAKPYATVFGGSSALFPRAELSRELFSWTYGQLGLGISVGYFSKSAQACVHSDDVANLCAQRAAHDETALRLIPVGLLAVYRFPLLIERRVMPLIPHAKLGLAVDPWYVTSGDGTVAQKGVTLGLAGAVGFSVRLDGVDKQSTAALYGELGIAHTSLFIEVGRTQAPLLRAATKLDVGATSWCGGLTIEL
jgi:hypothetical protein